MGKSRQEGSRPFELLYRKYDAWYDAEPGRSLFALEVRALRRALGGCPAGPTLEIGVGSGRFAEALGVRFGLDPAVRPLALARRRGIICAAGDGERLPFDAGVFDVCLLMVTLCFVPNPGAVLEEAFRVLRPGGAVVLGMVLAESPWGRVYRDQGRQGHPFYSLATFYTHGEVLRLLAGAGFAGPETVSTLFQSPGKSTYEPEEPDTGYDPAAGFTVFKAKKPVP